MATFNELREQVAYGVGEPTMENVNRDHIAGFINMAARDIRNTGWLIRMQSVESVQLLSNEFEYDVPARFAYIKELRIGDTSTDNASIIEHAYGHPGVFRYHGCYT